MLPLVSGLLHIKLSIQDLVGRGKEPSGTSMESPLWQAVGNTFIQAVITSASSSPLVALAPGTLLLSSTHTCPSVPACVGPAQNCLSSVVFASSSSAQAELFSSFYVFLWCCLYSLIFYVFKLILIWVSLCTCILNKETICVPCRGLVT